MSIILHLYNIISNLLPSKSHHFRRFLLQLAKCKIERNVCLNHNVRVYGNALSIGVDTWVSSNSIFSSSFNKDEMISIEGNCDIGPNVLFVTGTHKIGDKKRRAGEGLCLPINVGEGTWIGASSTILGGANIGKGTIVASGSVVVGGDYPDNILLAGIPAQIKKKLIV